MKYEMSFIHVLELVVGVSLMMLVLVGFKTKLSALVLVTWLFVSCILGFLALRFSAGQWGFGDFSNRWW